MTIRQDIAANILILHRSKFEPGITPAERARIEDRLQEVRKKLDSAPWEPIDVWEACSRHDWYYVMSDDERVFKAGVKAERQLIALCKTDPRFRAVYDSWARWLQNRGQPDNPPEPSRPE